MRRDKKTLFVSSVVLLFLINLLEGILLFNASVTCTYSQASVNSLLLYKKSSTLLIDEMASLITTNKLENIAVKLKKDKGLYVDINKEVNEVLIGPYVFDKKDQHYRLKSE